MDRGLAPVSPARPLIAAESIDRLVNSPEFNDAARAWHENMSRLGYPTKKDRFGQPITFADYHLLLALEAKANG